METNDDDDDDDVVDDENTESVAKHSVCRTRPKHVNVGERNLITKWN